MLDYVREMFFDFYPNADGLMIESRTTPSATARIVVSGSSTRSSASSDKFPMISGRRSRKPYVVYPHYFNGAEVPGFGVRAAKLSTV